MSRSTLGPIYPCPKCGAAVQLAERSFGRTRLEEVATGQRHDCPARPAYTPVAGPIHECPLCEAAATFEHEGVRYDALTIALPMERWKRHECEKPEPLNGKAIAPVPVPLADHRLRGVARDLQ